MLFGGASYMVLGDSDFIDVDAVAGANFGVSQRFGSGNLGLMYDYRQAASDDSDDRSEVIGPGQDVDRPRGETSENGDHATTRT